MCTQLWHVLHIGSSISARSARDATASSRQYSSVMTLQIPPPPPKNPIGEPGELGEATAGIDCSLVLSPAQIVTSLVIDLRNPEIGQVPLSVFFLPTCPWVVLPLGWDEELPELLRATSVVGSTSKLSCKATHATLLCLASNSCYDTYISLPLSPVFLAALAEWPTRCTTRLPSPPSSGRSPRW
jgi:hypothetical protein